MTDNGSNDFYDDIKRIMRTLKLTIEQAMDALEIPVAERGIYTSRISNV